MALKIQCLCIYNDTATTNNQSIILIMPFFEHFDNNKIFILLFISAMILHYISYLQNVGFILKGRSHRLAFDVGSKGSGGAVFMAYSI